MNDFFYEVEVVERHEELSSKRYFKEPLEVKKYLETVFPFAERDFDSIIDCIKAGASSSFSIKNLYDISISTKKIFDNSKLEEKSMFGNSDLSVFEVFKTEDAPIIRGMFYKFINRISRKEECIDSYRIGLKSSEKSMKEYEEYRENCCCGSTDIVEKIKNQEYMFGCNYGH